jgi:hypothetical protein
MLPVSGNQHKWGADSSYTIIHKGSRDPHDPTALTRTFFDSGPKSYNALRSRIGTFLHPQDPLLISRQYSREIGFRDVAKLVGTVHLLTKTPNPDGSKVNASLFVGDFPIGKSEHPMSRFTCTTNSRTPNSDGTCAIPSLRHLLSLLFRESRDRDFTVRYFLHREIPNVESRLPGILCHVSL